MLKEDKESSKQEKDYDFMTTGENPVVKRLPITQGDAGPLETKEHKFERYLRQLSRCVCACNLCELGSSQCHVNNTFYDPHCSNPITFNKIALVKFQPTSDDISNGLFNNIKCMFNELNFDKFYKTSIIKCYGESDYKCPYFDLEIKASSNLIKLFLLFDKKSCDYFGVEYILDKVYKYDGYKVCCCDEISVKKFLKLIKLSETNLQIHNNLFV